MKIEIKNLKFFPLMSEETNAINCDLFVDGKKTAYCKNQGCGGCTDYTAYPNQRELLQQAETYAKTFPDYEYEWKGVKHSFKMTLETFIDTEVEKQLCAKETARYNKKLIKDCLKYICIKEKNGYKSIGWKNYTVTQLLGTPVGTVMLQKKVDELKERGEVILNTNLVGITL